MSSCGDDGVVNGEVNSQNKLLDGTKWSTTNWDYSIGDDWAGTLDETYNIYFYSQTEGAFYYGRKDLDSDFGSSSSRSVAHFTYNVDGNIVRLDYINNPMNFSNTLNLAGNKISMNGISFNKGTISSSDKDWLNTLQGRTGSCKWSYDLRGGLYISGKGDMADYTSFSSTPWGVNNRIPNYVQINNDVTSVGSHAFANPSISTVFNIAYSMHRIGTSAFAGACISSIDLPDEITTIENNAFAGCNYLTKVSIPMDIVEIGDCAFSDCKSASLTLTKNLKRVGAGAFGGCEINSWTDSKVLEYIGGAAFGKINTKELDLPSIKELGHLAFYNTKIEKIHIGPNLQKVTGIPFVNLSSSGTVTIDAQTPLALKDDFIDENCVRKWNLVVPSGCKNKYMAAPYWKNFKDITEDPSLESGNGGSDDGEDDNQEDDNQEDDNQDIIIPSTYTNNGKTYKWIKVDSPTLPTFYIMQTELNPDSHFRIGEDAEIGILNKNGDYAVIRSEFRTFLERIKEETGLQMRAPTAEEWMYAASGGNKSKGYIYSGSDVLDEVGWYKTNSIASIHYFAMKAPNELGLYDMSGNYGEITNNDLNAPTYIDGRIYGGCWNDDATDCKITSYVAQPGSGYIPGTKIKNVNAFDSRKYTVRLVFTAPE